MTAIEFAKISLGYSQYLWGLLLEDLDDADLLVRPVPGANHIAWQFGHCILGESSWVGDLGGTVPTLPAGFAEKHSQKNNTDDGPTGFLSKAEYLRVFNEVRGALLARVATLTEADLDKPTSGSLAAFAPTWGSLIALAESHAEFHLGQVTPVRRKLGKPVKF